MENLEQILQRIEKARLQVDKRLIVKLIAVSKNVDTDAVISLYNQGQRAFGENRVQELKRKNEILTNLPLQWHFIGRLQKNKINQLIDLSPTLIHSLDSIDLALSLDKRLQAKDKKVKALIQINSAKEESKAGFMPESAIEDYLFIKENCKNINLCGVMSIGAHSDDMTLVQKSFEKSHNIFENLKQYGARVCSMGMSNDFELAIKCGSNLLRLGSILFKD